MVLVLFRINAVYPYNDTRTKLYGVNYGVGNGAIIDDVQRGV